jgi:hypothetical protein
LICVSGRIIGPFHKTVKIWSIHLDIQHGANQIFVKVRIIGYNPREFTINPAILGLRNCGHSSGRLAEKWGQKYKRKRHFQFFLPPFFCQLMTPKQTSEIKPRIAAINQTTQDWPTLAPPKSDGS